MTVTVVSNDHQLFRLCRSVARELFRDKVTVVAAPPDQPRYEGVVRIWDVDLNSLGKGEKLRGERGDLYVAPRSVTSTLNSCYPEVAGILLKPVERTTLRSFLSAALNRHLGEDQHPDRHLTERQDLLQALLEASLRLQEYDQNRTNFLARALHDFRTPLTTLHGYCSMWLGQKFGDLSEEQADVLRRMQHSIGRLTKLSRMMFELSIRRHTSMNATLVRRPIEKTIMEAIQEITPIADEMHIKLSVEVQAPETELPIDAERIEQLLVNLLENACKFTPRFGSITVRGYRSSLRTADSQEVEGEPAYRIDVQDNGSGVAPEHIESIFEEFTSYAGGQDRSGGGLGLAICKMIINEHKGTIWAESGGSGTTISFCLPLNQEFSTVQKNSTGPDHWTQYNLPGQLRSASHAKSNDPRSRGRIGG